MLTNHEKLLAIRDDEMYRHVGWNGYEAYPISKELVNLAMKLLSVFENGKMDIYPTGRGTIQFEWEDENDNYFEVELGEDKQIGVYLSLKGD